MMKQKIFSFFGGSSKDSNYQGNPHTIAALRATITEKIQVIIQKECACIINNFARCIQ